MPTHHPSEEPANVEAAATACRHDLPHRDKPLLWDIFCQVIDNYGDVGICWRLATDLAQRGHSVRLWLDDARVLTWMAPGAAQGDWPGISVQAWPSASATAASPAQPLADGWIEAFGCEIPSVWLQTQVQAAQAQARRPVWINLEYLSAEPFAMRSHGLPSPVLHGPAIGWTKYFCYPGFGPASGGLLRRPSRQRDATNWAHSDLAAYAPREPDERSVLLFSYASAPVGALLQKLIRSDQSVQLLVAAGPTTQAVRRVLAELPETPGAQRMPGPIAATEHEWRSGPLRLRFLPHLPQSAFDVLLALCDLNLVRGEDSLAQAVQAGKPCVWHIYPQDDGAHAVKLQAYLDAIAADAHLRAWHGVWNGAPAAAQVAPELAWPWATQSTWRQSATSLAQRLGANADTCSQLIDWAVHGAALRRLP